MPTVRTPEVDCRIFTFAEGMLSPLAHDLEIVVTEGSLSVSDGRLEAVFDAGSLRVSGTVKGGRTDPSGLSKSDYGKIEQSIRSDVLKSGRHPQVRFVGRIEGDFDTDPELCVDGELELCGVRRPLRLEARREADHWTCETVLHQPDFRIRPYKAMMGTLKVKADVEVRVRVPAEAR